MLAVCCVAVHSTPVSQWKERALAGRPPVRTSRRLACRLTGCRQRYVPSCGDWRPRGVRCSRRCCWSGRCLNRWAAASCSVAFPGCCGVLFVLLQIRVATNTRVWESHKVVLQLLRINHKVTLPTPAPSSPVLRVPADGLAAHAPTAPRLQPQGV
jgi:hypothetical protein